MFASRNKASYMAFVDRASSRPSSWVVVQQQQQQQQLLAGVVVAAVVLASSFESLQVVGGDALTDSTIPPWLDAYGATPNITLTLIFNDTTRISNVENNGEILALNQTSLQPSVHISGPSLDPYASYTFLTIDPDAYCPSNPVLKNVIHWIISNIPGSTLPSQDIAQAGEIVLHYLKPTAPTHFLPPYGVHRYYNLLFKQVFPHQNITTPLPDLFDTRNFTQKYSLGYPIAGTIFKLDLDALNYYQEECLG